MYLLKTIPQLATMRYYAVLLVLTYFSFAYGGWLWIYNCGRPDLGGFGVNGNCVPLPGDESYFRKIECRKDTAVELVCWDPLCGNCEERDTTKLGECNDGQSMDCIDGDIPFSKMMGNNYVLIGTFSETTVHQQLCKNRLILLISAVRCLIWDLY